MKFKGFSLIVGALIILFLTGFPSNAQVVVERSKEKVIISGVQYYVHVVKKGETAYSISKAYGLTVADLVKGNPQAASGINEGQSLRIPAALVTETLTPEQVSHQQARDDNKYIYHTLKQGETVYFLSKSYKVPVEDIVACNPGLDITKMSVGMEIAVQRKEPSPSRKTTDSNDKKHFFHKVLDGETLSSIADKYGISARDLKKENKDIKFPLAGDLIRVPGTKPLDNKTPESAKSEAAPLVEKEPQPVVVKPSGFTEFNSLSGTINVAVLLPFYLRENSTRESVDSSKTNKGKTTYKYTNRDEDWVYPRSLDFVEMYEGILLAADTLTSRGLNVNIYPFDIGRDSFELESLIRSGRLEKMDLIIGPVYSHNLSIVASYARNLGIPVVSPVPLQNNNVLAGNPGLFLANSTLEVSQKALARKVGEDHGRNIIFVNSDSTNTDEDVIRFHRILLKELSGKIQHNEVKFKEILFSGLSMFDTDSDSKLSGALSENSENIVIIASEDPPVISKVIVDLDGLSRKYDLKVFGYSTLMENVNIDPKYFFDLGLMVYSPSSIDYTKPNVIAFNSSFRKKFLTEPVEKSFAWQGYDIAYYFMSGLARRGKDFIEHPELHKPELLQTDFDFVRNKSGDGFENQKLYLIRYSKDYEVITVAGNK